MSKFKVGDRVRGKTTADDKAVRGVEGVVSGDSTVMFAEGFDGWGSAGREWYVEEADLEFSALPIPGDEFEAMRKCSDAIFGLDSLAAQRVINYLEDRFV